jgi:hypothetical protein
MIPLYHDIGLLGVIGSVQSKNGWKILIVDRGTIRIISSVCSMSEIMDKGVTS